MVPIASNVVKQGPVCIELISALQMHMSNEPPGLVAFLHVIFPWHAANSD